MHFDTDGIYTLQYTATDSCGNETIEERTVEVISLMTTLFADGTFIINEKSTDRDANIALHGAVTNEYIPFDPNGSSAVSRYEFNTNSTRPWDGVSSTVKSVEIGSPISPRKTSYWFYYFETCTAFDFNGLDTSLVTDMNFMFRSCRAMTSIDVSSFDTSSVRSMENMFGYCQALASLDLSTFNTSKVLTFRNMFMHCETLPSLDLSTFNTSSATDMSGMFSDCEALASLNVASFDTSLVTNMDSMFGYDSALQALDLSSFNTPLLTRTNDMFSNSSALTTIFVDVAKFTVANVTQSYSMFVNNSHLVGGAGTVWRNTNPSDKTYARVDNPPSAPGYFTARP